MKHDFDAVILMGHGSRVPGAGKNMEMVAERLKESGFCNIVEVCYMERLGQRFGTALDICVEKGARRVALIPYFLHMGLHTKVDIPRMMQREAQRHPEVGIVFGHNLGFDDLLVDIVRKRIEESAELKDVREIDVEERDAYPLRPEDEVFVTMPQDEAEHFKHHHHEH